MRRFWSSWLVRPRTIYILEAWLLLCARLLNTLLMVFNNISFYFIYLGCLVFMRYLKIVYFDEMVWKVRDKISGWANKLLSFYRNLMLIRHVLSMSLYLFHVVKPSALVMKHLERLFPRFLRGDSKTWRQIHWCRWSSVCFPVKKDGLRIRSFDDLAMAQEVKL